MSNPKNLDIVFRGKTYKIGKNEKYKNITQVAKVLKVPTAELKAYRSSTDKTKTFVNPSGESVSQDLRKPLILRDFGIKRISNKELLKQSSTIKRDNTQIQSFIGDVPSGITLKVNITGKVYYTFSDSFVPINVNLTENIKTGDDIEDVLYRWLINYLNLSRDINAPKGVYHNYFKVIPDEIFVRRNNQGGQTMKLQDMILREEQPPSISNMYSNVIEDGEWKHCIHDYMNELYGKRYSKKTIEKLNTTNDIYNFCVSKNIKMIAYDINGECILSNYPTKKNPVKNLIYIAYNNHLYPLKNNYLNKVKIIPSNIEFITDSQKKIIEILEQGRYVSNVSLSGSKIVSFTDEETKYINNDEYLKCKEILAKFGLEDKIYDSISLITIGKTIKDLYVTKCDKSLFLNHEKFVKGGFNYNNPDVKGDYNCYDFSKAYPSILSKLPFLITCNMIKDDVCNNIDLDEDHYLYIAKPKMSSILLPDTNAYSGSHLKYCKKEGLEFIILEKLSCDRLENHYTLMINDLYKKLDNKSFKMIMNTLIGQFENSTKKLYNNFVKFCNDDELKTVDEKHYVVNLEYENDDFKNYFLYDETTEVQWNYQIPKNFNNDYFYENIVLYDEVTEPIWFIPNYSVYKQPIFEQPKTKLNMVYEVKERTNIYNRKPIAIQIKDECRKIMYELMKKLSLTDGMIKSINTDCIMYVGEKYLKKTSSEMGCWKKIDYKEITSCFNYTNDDLSFITKNDNNNVFGNCYAGCGKSYKIINDIIPKMGNDYIVLTPSHSSVKEYKNLKLNCDVIQKYEYNNTIPDVSNIIIDEVGMNSLKAMTLLLNWFMSGKNIYSYGDFKQLLPVNVDKPLLSSIYQNFIFGKTDNMTTNYRNNFSKEFYDNIIDGKSDNKKLIKQYGKITSNNVICYTNKTCQKYNTIIMNRLGIESIESIGCKVICNSNDLRELNIYNKFQFTVTGIEDNNIVLDNQYKISRICYGMYFNPAYARTIYSIQGESMNDFYYPVEDYNFLNDRTTYTIISRLKGNVYIDDSIVEDIEYDDYDDDEEHEPVELDF
jgi:hypothetical protein